MAIRGWRLVVSGWLPIGGAGVVSARRWAVVGKWVVGNQWSGVGRGSWLQVGFVGVAMGPTWWRGMVGEWVMGRWYGVAGGAWPNRRACRCIVAG